MKTAALWMAILMIGASAAVAEEAVQTKPQTACPVMGGSVNKKIHVDYNGQRVYLCCNACVETFKSDPEKYLKIMREEGISPEKAPVE